MNEITKHFTEDSMLEFTYGEQIKGAEDVSEVIMSYCRDYNKGYMNKLKELTVIGACGTLVIIGTGLGIKYIIKHIKKSKKEISKEEA